jgi:hypothetical protein
VFAFIAPLSVAFLVAVFGRDEVVFLVFTAIMVLGGLVVLTAGPETRGRGLDEPAFPPESGSSRVIEYLSSSVLYTLSP